MTPPRGERGLAVCLLAVQARADAVRGAQPEGLESRLVEDVVRLLNAVGLLLEARDELRREAEERHEAAVRHRARRFGGGRKAAFCLGQSVAYRQAAERRNEALGGAFGLRLGGDADVIDR